MDMNARERLEGWETVLETLHDMKRPYEVGVWDCVITFGDIILAITGEDLIAEFRGRYHTQEEAQSLLDSVGGYEKVLEAKLGPPCPVSHARRGDAMVAEQDGVLLLGVCCGIRAAFVAGPEQLEEGGFIFIHLRNCKAVYHV